MKATITLIPKPDKDTTKKKRKLQCNIFDKYRYKSPQQNISKSKQAIERILHQDQEEFIPGMQDRLKIWK